MLRSAVEMLTEGRRNRPPGTVAERSVPQLLSIAADSAGNAWSTAQCLASSHSVAGSSMYPNAGTAKDTTNATGGRQAECRASTTAKPDSFHYLRWDAGARGTQRTGRASGLQCCKCVGRPRAENCQERCVCANYQRQQQRRRRKL